MFGSRSIVPNQAIVHTATRPRMHGNGAFLVPVVRTWSEQQSESRRSPCGDRRSEAIADQKPRIARWYQKQLPDHYHIAAPSEVLCPGSRSKR